MSVLLSLPVLLLDSIVSDLDERSVMKLSLSCKYLYSVLNDDDSPSNYWRDRCLRYSHTRDGENKDEKPVDWCQGSWKDLYANVYKPFGSLLLGVWAAESMPHGGMLKVVAQPPKMVGLSILSNKAYGGTLKTIPVFEICFEKSTGGQSGIVCYRSSMMLYNAGARRGSGSHSDDEQKSEENLPHIARIELNCNSQGEQDEFLLSCSDECEHDRFERRSRKTQAFLELTEAEGNSQERIHSFYFSYLSEALTFDLWLSEMQSEQMVSKGVRYKRLEQSDPSSASHHPLEGIWKGSYASHGIEFVNMRLLEDGFLTAQKITGDPHIWASKVTFRLDLSTEIQLAEETQLPEVEWREEQPTGLEPKLKYRGYGQIAEFGYKNHSWTPIEVITFSNDTFAVHWIQLDALSIFDKLKRSELDTLDCKNTLLQHKFPVFEEFGLDEV